MLNYWYEKVLLVFRHQIWYIKTVCRAMSQMDIFHGFGYKLMSSIKQHYIKANTYSLLHVSILSQKTVCRLKGKSPFTTQKFVLLIWYILLSKVV